MRKLEVGIANKTPDEPPTVAKAHFEHKAKVVGGVVKETAKIAVFGVCAYVVLDTVRQIAVERFS